MKIKSWLFSLLLVFVGIAGAYSLTLPINKISAVSEDASVWDGNDYSDEFDEYNLYKTDENGVVNYYIYTAKDFLYFAHTVNNGNTYNQQVVNLCVDIDLNGKKWKPIGVSENGDSATQFAGTFNGNGYTIYNLNIQNPNSPWVGLFSTVANATLKNFNLVSANINVSNEKEISVGAVAGSMTLSSIINVSVSGEIYHSGATGNVGGLVGEVVGKHKTSIPFDKIDFEKNFSDEVKILNCRSLASVSGVGSVGGIAGYTSRSVVIKECYNEGAISGIGNSSNYIGGILGRTSSDSTSNVYNYTLITHCYNAGDLNFSHARYAGGILGYSAKPANERMSYFTILYSYNKGDFVYDTSSNLSESKIGGLVGYSNIPRGVYITDENYTSFDNVFNVGEVKNDKGENIILSQTEYSLIVNVQPNASIFGCNDIYYNESYAEKYTGSVSTVDTTEDRLTGITESSIKLQKVPFLEDSFRTANFGGTNFFGKTTSGEKINNVKNSEIWGIQSGINDGYPYLKRTININNANNDLSSTTATLWKGEGTKDNPYLIYTAEDLARVAKVYNNGKINDKAEGLVYNNEGKTLGGEIVSSTSQNGNENTTSQTKITYFSLQNDIDLSSKAWTPIGTGPVDDGSGKKFINAVFDGNNFTISGINCSMHANYKYLGLFGCAENAIIRNVIVDDFRFIGTEEGDETAKGTIVGCLKNSYVINCADFVNRIGTTESEKVDLYTIGSVDADGKSYVVYGENNNADNAFSDNNIYIDANMSNLNQLYLTYINPNGGTVYDTIKRDSVDEKGEVSVHIGQAELLIASSSNTTSSSNSYKIHTAINSQFGSQYLSCLPTDISSGNSYNTSSIILKEGEVINGYNYGIVGGTELSSSDINDLISDGIEANWGEEGKTTTITIHYNSYENSYGYGNEESIITFDVNYNQYFSNESFKEKVLEALEIKGITRTGYEVAGIFTGFTKKQFGGEFSGFDYFEDGVGLFLNQNEDYYIKWQGNTSYSIQVNLVDLDSFGSVSTSPKNYTWTQAVESLKVNFSDGTVSEIDLLRGNYRILESGSAVFGYNTSNVDLQDENITIEIKLKDGFSFKNNDDFLQETGFLNNKVDEQVNDYIQKFGYSSLINNLNQDNTLILQRMVGDGEININIGRTNYSYNMAIDEDVSFGLTLPQVTNSGYKVLFMTKEGNYTTLNEVEPNMFNKVSGYGSYYFGVNMFDKYFIASTDDFDRVDFGSKVPILNINLSADNKVEGIVLNIQDEYSANHYFLVALSTLDGKRTQTIYEINRPVVENGEIKVELLDRLVYVTEGILNDVGENYQIPIGTIGYNLNYFTNTNFGIVFSTEDASSEIVDYPANPEVLVFEDLNEDGIYDMSEDEAKKIFYNLVASDDKNYTELEVYLNYQTTIANIEILQDKVTADFNFKFATISEDENGKLQLVELTENTPQIDISIGNLQDENVENRKSYNNSNGISLNINNYNFITFTIKNNNYYQFAHRDSGIFPTVKSMMSSGMATEIDKTTTMYMTPLDEKGEYLSSGSVADPQNPTNSINCSSFSSRDPSDPSGGYKYSYTYTMSFPSAIFPSSWEIIFVVERVDFHLSVSSVYKQTYNGEEFEDTTNATTLKNTENDDEVTELDLLFGDEFVIQTNTQNAGYTFQGFEVRKDGETTFFPPLNLDIEYDKTSYVMTIEDFLSFYKDEYTTLSSDDKYSYEICAVYESESVAFQSSIRKFMILDYNGNENDFYLNTVTGSVLNTTGSNLTSGTFNYFSANASGNELNSSIENGFATFNLLQSNYYEFSGFAIMTEETYNKSGIVDNFGDSYYYINEERTNMDISVNSGDLEITSKTMRISGRVIADYIRTLLEEDEMQNIYTDSTVYILPILKQKTLEITITDGSSNKVYSNSKNETTDTEIVMTVYYVNGVMLNFSSSYYIGESVNRGNVFVTMNKGNLNSIILNSYFYYQIGYASTSWTIRYKLDDGEDGTSTAINTHNLSTYFNENNLSTTFTTDYAIQIERFWTANTFQVNYYSGDSRYNTFLGNNIFGNSIENNYSRTARYNSTTTLENNSFSLTGYQFVGWRVFKNLGYQTVEVVNPNAGNGLFSAGDDITNLITGTDQILDENNFGLSLEVYAVWQAKTYKVLLNANGGNIDGQETITLSLEYNSTFMEAVCDGYDIEELFDTYLNQIVKRPGFQFDGFYSYDGSSSKSMLNLVTEETYLRNTISGFVDTNNLDEPVLTLFATWVYDESTSIIFENDLSYNYTGDKIEVALSDFEVTGNNIVVTNTDTLFNLQYANEEAGVDISFTFTRDENSSTEIVQVGDEENGCTYKFLIGENVGSYQLNLSYNLTDIGSNVYSIGDFNFVTVSFIISITKADISFKQSDEKGIWLKNIQYLVSVVEEQEVIDEYNSFETFEELRQSVSQKEGFELTSESVYEYLFMKYYNMINTKSSQIHTLKNWKIRDGENGNDYISYYGTYYYGADEYLDNFDGLSDERRERAEILKNNMFLLSYEFGVNIREYVLAGEETSRYNVGDVLLTSDTADAVIGEELSISSIEIYSTSVLVPNYSYTVRAYITEASTGKLDNYNVATDSSGRRYIVLDDVYMLIQVLRLKNNAISKSTYYTGDIPFVNWVGSDQLPHYYYDGSTFYQFEKDSELYIDLEIETSNAGQSDVDTIFDFYDKENYLNVSSIRIVTFDDDTGFNFTNYTSYFNIILDETFTFTIFNVVDTAQISLTPKYFTKKNQFQTFTDLPESVLASLETGLFSVTSFTYSTDNASTKTYSLTDSNGNATPLNNGQYFSEDGKILLFTLENNNSNAPIFYTSSAVVSVGIRINQSLLTEYIKYYTTTDEIINDLTQEYSVTTEYTLTLKTKNENGVFESDIEYTDGSLTYLEYYSVFSDLVKIYYDMNLSGVSNTNSSLLQLNYDTTDALTTLVYSNLVISDMKYTTVTGAERSYTNLFDSITGRFMGADIYSPHKFITLKAYWKIGELDISTLSSQIKYAVGTLDTLYAVNVGYMNNEESTFFNYTYELYKGDELLASNNNFDQLAISFDGGGTVKDSGTYTLKFIVTIKDNYKNILDTTSEESVTAEIEFTLEFVKNIIEDITFIPESEEIMYDGLNHTGSFIVEISYQQYKQELDDYDSENIVTERYQYGTEKKFTFKILKDGTEEVNEIIDVGRYEISVNLSEDYFEWSENSKVLTYVINRYDIDLSTYELDRTKNFNSQDTAFTNNIRVAGEVVSLTLTRADLGEDLGDYDLFLDNFTSLNNNNFTVSYDGTVLFDGTDYTAQKSTTAIAKLSIVQAGDLRIYWEISDSVPNIASFEYNENGYSVAFTEQAEIVITTGGENAKTLNLKMYDLGQGSEISNETILNILHPLLADINIILTSAGNEYTTAVDAGNYSFSLRVDEGMAIGQYFKNIYFSSDYTLQIISEGIDVNSFSFVKEYDGLNTIYLTLSNQVIDDISTYQGIYVEGVFAETHAGEDIAVNVTLKTTSENINDLINFQLSSSLTSGQILKREAEIIFSFKEDTFTYGELSSDNFADQITYIVKDGEEDITELFRGSFYTINYTLSAGGSEMQTNTQGYIYANTYTLQTLATYDDFDLDEVLPSLQVTPFEYSLEVGEGFITVTALDEVSKAYVENIYVEETGDSIQVSFYVPSDIVGTTNQVGDYNLTLENGQYSYLYSNGNIRVSIDENNTGFKVGSYDGTLYLEIEDEEILTRPYNAKTYTITASETTFIITIENEDETFSVQSNFKFYNYNNGELTPIENSTLVFESIGITSSNQNTFSQVGNYKLTLDAVATGYTNVSFIKNYTFSITPVELNFDGTGLFNKVYDGTTIVEIEVTEGIFEGDEVIVRGIYQNATAGVDKDVRLTLSGSSAKNYTLSSSTTKGTIEKKNVTISLAQTSYQYGDIRTTTNLNFVVKDGDNEISKGFYTVVKQEIQYEGTGILPVNVDGYDVEIEVESENYNITPTTLHFEITKRQINITFASAGIYMASFGSEETLSDTFIRDYTTEFNEQIEIEFTRESGSEVKYYKITDAQIVSQDATSLNYEIGEIVDNVGAYRIVSSSSRVYLLASNKDTITSLEDGVLLEFTYDGNSYDRVALEVGDASYTLKIYNSQNTLIEQTFALNLYTYNEDTDVYTRLTTIFDPTIKAESFSISELIQNAGNYYLTNSDVTSQNFAVKLGKNNTLFAFQVTVNKRQAFFMKETIEQTFNNENVVIFYENAKEILTNILANDNFGVTLEFKTEDGSPAKYAGNSYKIEGTIIGNTNYELVYTLADGTQVTGTILKAPIQVNVNDQNVVYGDETTFLDVQIAYTFQSETIDLKNYEKLDELSLVITLEDALGNLAEYSSSGYLNAGEYKMKYKELISDDFYIDTNGFISNGVAGTNLVTTFTVSQKTLSLLKTSEELQTIFTKYYDGTHIVEIYRDGTLRFGFEGEISGDDVQVSSAEYASINVGTGIEVKFLLDGNDSGNYFLPSYTNGLINAITIKLSFDKGGETEEEENNILSNVDLAGLSTIEKLNYPFVNNETLTSNSQTSETAGQDNFPSTLTGKTGYYFSNWVMEFEVIANSVEREYIENLAKQLNLSNAYTGNILTVTVGNNRATVSFINTLLSDESDYFGYYYLGKEEVEFTFKAVWTTETFEVSVTTEKDGVNTTEYATTFVNDYQMPQYTYRNSFAYGTPLTIKVVLDDHIVARFFDEKDVEYENGNGISITTTLNPETQKEEAVFFVEKLSRAMNIVVKLDFKDVTVTLNLQDYDGVVAVDDERFQEYSDGVFRWETNYEDIADVTLDELPVLTYVGSITDAYVFSDGNAGSSQVPSSLFDSTLLVSYVYKNGDGYSITYTPIFDELSVSVILNFNYDGNFENNDTDDKKEISVGYKNTFNSSDDWVETPLREGYDFLGWYFDSESETAVTGESTMESMAQVVLFARWQIQQNNVYLTFDDKMTLESALVNDEEFEYKIENGNYIFENLTFSDKIVLTFTLTQGYNIGSVTYHYFGGEDIIVSTFENDGTVGKVTFSVPAKPTAYLEVKSGFNSNEITVSGEHIENVTAKTTAGEEIDVENNAFTVDTNVDIVIEVKIVKGYLYNNEISLTENFTATFSEETNILTITLFNINSQLKIEVGTRVRGNKVTVVFEEPSHNIEFVVDNIITTENIFEVFTEETFAFYTDILHGYKISEVVSTDEDTEISFNVYNDETSLLNGYFYVEVKNVTTDITLTIKTTKEKFTVIVEVIAYDEYGRLVENTDNVAYVDGKESVTYEYLTEVTLSATTESEYGFAGFSLNKNTIFDSKNPTTYVVEDNVTIYAIFSKLKYNIIFMTYNHIDLDNSEEEIYESLYYQIFYEDETFSQQITGTTLFYGSSITLYLQIPNGYTYYGFGWYQRNHPDDKKYIAYAGDEFENSIFLEASIFSELENEFDVNVFVALQPKEVQINVSSYLDFDGIYEEDLVAGNISLVNENAEGVNSYGYIEGTNNHYSSNSFNGQLLDSRSFQVISHTNSSIYLKIYSEKEDYYFSKVSASNGITVKSLGRFHDGIRSYYLYQFAGYVGGSDRAVEIEVYFKPEKRIIDFDFVNEDGSTVEGGSFFTKTDPSNSYKVWSDGNNFDKMSVTSFVDSSYMVVAYVRLGFVINTKNSYVIFDESVVNVYDISYELLLTEETNYTYIVTFMVKDYKANSKISVVLSPQTYTVLLKDTTLEENEVLLEIRNAKFHEVLDLSEENSENLVFDEEVFSYSDGYLNIVQTKEDHNFGGYFTYENGVGTQYINTLGVADKIFLENGYVLDEQNNIYILSENAEIIDGQVVITLYLYWLYLKTQITFEVVPEVEVDFDALDIVQGVDEYSSWFNEDSPLYIEVAYNTDINIIAPQLNGYSFHRFLIKQYDGAGNQLQDVVSYQESVPWSTNEYDNIVRVEITMFYFAKVDVILYGGEMEYEISQTTEDNRARVLLSQGYVDTTKEFTLSALDSDGYTFQYWINMSNNMRYSTQNLTLQITEKTSFFLFCQGKTITLKFDEYDATNGQIYILEINSPLNGISAKPLGVFSNGSFSKTTTSVDVRVGDTVTFVTKVHFGYGVEWNIDDVELKKMDSEYYYFTVKLTEELVGEAIEIIPIFSGESVAFYFSQDFAESEKIENAQDNNDATNCGYFVFNGEPSDVVVESIFVNIEIGVVLSLRYEIREIFVKNNSGVSIDVTECYNSDLGTITFTSQYLQENNIAGTLILEVIYGRLYFEIGEMEEDGSGSEDGPYIISTIDELTHYMQKINSGAVNDSGIKYSEAHYVLVSSFNLSAKFWTPIGTEENPFNGTFNFNGNTITSIYLAQIYSMTSYGGLFGVVGEKANIYLSEDNFWYVYVIVSVVGVLVILLVILLVWNKKKKKIREELERR